jgi:hypothetical protein
MAGNGRTEIATENIKRLAHIGFTPRPLDYLMALLTWPHHKLRKTLRGLARAITLPAKITEADFLDGTFAS